MATIPFEVPDDCKECSFFNYAFITNPLNVVETKVWCKRYHHFSMQKTYEEFHEAISPHPDCIADRERMADMERVYERHIEEKRIREESEE